MEQVKHNGVIFYIFTQLTILKNTKFSLLWLKPLKDYFPVRDVRLPVFDNVFYQGP